MQTKWNTGRHYSAKGQRIAAQLDGAGIVHFCDVDRGIAGSFTPLFPVTSEYALRESVMLHYDHNNYRTSWGGETMETLATLAATL